MPLNSSIENKKTLILRTPIPKNKAIALLPILEENSLFLKIPSNVKKRDLKETTRFKKDPCRDANGKFRPTDQNSKNEVNQDFF